HYNHYLSVMGLLKPGATMAQTNDELGTISGRVQRQFPDQETGHIAYVEDMNGYFTRGVRVAMPALIGAAIFVLLISCSNVANLLLARAATRRKEMAVRLSMGATRWRVMRQLLTESVMLATFGGALGLLMASWGFEALLKGIPEGMAKYIPGWNWPGLSYAALFFSASVSILTGVLFGLAPGWQAGKSHLDETLEEGGGNGASVKCRRGLLRNALVVSQLDIAMVLVIGEGVLVRSLIETQRADLGTKPNHVVTMKLELSRDKYPEGEQRRNPFRRLLQGVEALPGVAGAGVVDTLPMTGRYNSGRFQIVGQPTFEKGKEPLAEWR